MNASDIRRVDFGYFIRPASETGTGKARVESLLGYIIGHPGGLVLFDTGLGFADDETEAHYRPHRRPLTDALRGAGVAADDVRFIVNCHLHFDHCGGNPAFAGRPIIVQAAELEGAQQPGYTVPEVVDFPGATYQTIDGELELLPGLWVLPTPGHTPGHQSIVLRCDDGSVVLAGQAHDTATEFAADLRAALVSREGGDPATPTYLAWMDRVLEFDPRRILFAHDVSVVEPLR
jgi:glyoxylase-like metal-dependent hydrolase (beta-lactamase superfamily II)